MKIEISRTVLDAIRTHAVAEAPLEACGLLFGTVARIEHARPARNVAGDPARHFEIDPDALFEAVRAERAGGPGLVGYYHSHPTGCAEPSETDRSLAAPDGKLWLIVADGDVTAWRSEAAGLVRIKLYEL